MSILWPCPLAVDAYVACGRTIDPPRPACPRCGAPTQAWHGYWRHLRDAQDRLIWIPRVRCPACGRTQALLPWFVVPWRWDAVTWIGRALELAAQGFGHRQIAAALARPETTVRGWLRRLRSGAALLARRLLAAAVRAGWSGFELPVPALPRLAAAVNALAGRWARRHRRVVVVVDEAHLLTPAQLEELRLLTLMPTWTRGAPSRGSCWASRA